MAYFNNTTDLLFLYNETESWKACLLIQSTEEEAKIAGMTSWWLEGIVQLILTSVGLLANFLSIFILTRKTLGSKTFNQLLTALATLDSIFLLIMLYESIGRCFEISEEWDHVFTMLTPYFLYPVKAIAMTGSVYMMISVAVERYIAVYHPFTRIPVSLQSTKNGRRLSTRLMVYLLPVILFAVSFNIPKFFESQYHPEREPYVFITELRTDATYLVLNSWARLLFLGIIPVLVTSILNYKIFIAIRRSHKTSGRQGDDTLSIVLFFIVVIFLICSIPRIIILMFEVTILEEIRHCTKVHMNPFPFWNMMLGIFSHVLLVINPFLNFIVYCVIGKTFRLVAGQYLCKLCPCLSAYLPPPPTPHYREVAVRNTWSYIGPQDGGHMSGFRTRDPSIRGMFLSGSFRGMFLSGRNSFNGSTRDSLRTNKSCHDSNRASLNSRKTSGQDSIKTSMKNKRQDSAKAALIANRPDLQKISRHDSKTTLTNIRQDSYSDSLVRYGQESEKEEFGNNKNFHKFKTRPKERFGENFLSAQTRESFDQNLAAKILNGSCSKKKNMMKTVAMIELVEKSDGGLKKESSEPSEMVCIVEEMNYNENQKDSKFRYPKKKNSPKDNVELPFIELDSEDWPQLFGEENAAKNEENDGDLKTPENIVNSVENTDKHDRNNFTKNDTEDTYVEEDIITVPME